MTDLFLMISAPAQRALSSVGIKSIIDFTYHTRFEIENLHGIGKKVMILIEKYLESSNLKYMNETDNQEIDDYIDRFDDNVKLKLNEIRRAIRTCIPFVKEKMAYGMPTYYYHENVVHFAGYASHIGLYPNPSGVFSFEKEIDKYKWSKGSIQFPIDEKLPIELIIRITEYRIKEVINKILREES